MSTGVDPTTVANADAPLSTSARPASSTDAPTTDAACVFKARPGFRKRGGGGRGGGNVRKRSNAALSEGGEGDGDGDEEESAVVRKEKRERLLNKFSTKKRVDTDSKRLKTKHSFKSTRTGTSEQSASDNATRTYDIDTAHDRDQHSILQRKLDMEKSGEDVEEPNEDGPKKYKGLNHYKEYIKSDEKAKSKAMRKGPVRATSNVRYSCRFDYQPDICKDYKETGFCGYGDNCKFMHDRGDYKQGWELDRDWDAQQNGEEEENWEIHSDEEGDEFPFACHLCRKPFEDPIITKCGHYFCESCALENFRKSKKCAICDENTFGIFNRAVKLIKKIAERKELGIEAPQEEEEEEEDVEEGEVEGGEGGE